MAFNRRKNRFCAIILGRRGNKNPQMHGSKFSQKFILCRIHSSSSWTPEKWPFFRSSDAQQAKEWTRQRLNFCKYSGRKYFRIQPRGWPIIIVATWFLRRWRAKIASFSSAQISCRCDNYSSTSWLKSKIIASDFILWWVDSLARCAPESGVQLQRRMNTAKNEHGEEWTYWKISAPQNLAFDHHTDLKLSYRNDFW